MEYKLVLLQMVYILLVIKLLLEKNFWFRVIMSTITDNTMTINNGSITEILSMRKNYYESSSLH